MSTTVRRTYLDILRRCGMRQFIATSGMGYRYVCHLGDFLGENPFYNHTAFAAEILVCAEWLRRSDQPIVLDIGAHVGFWSTHLAQILENERAEIYAFEAVPATFAKLVSTIQALGLEARVHPVAAAVLEAPAVVQLQFSSRDSLFAQIRKAPVADGAGVKTAFAAGLTIDSFVESSGLVPSLIKIDVEGSEPRVITGASTLLRRNDRPALIFEYNPHTLQQTQADVGPIHRLADLYRLFYVDDFDGPPHRIPFGTEVGDLQPIDWVCNLFAVPPDQTERWESVAAAVSPRLSS